MDKNRLDEIHRKFILGEAKVSISGYIQSLNDALTNLKPSRVGDTGRLEIAKENLSNIKRYVRQLQEKITLMEEENTTLREAQSKDKE